VVDQVFAAIASALTPHRLPMKSLRRAGLPASLLFCAADIYWGITAVSFISLHNADAWLATPVLGIPVVQLIKLGMAIIAVAATATAMRVTAVARTQP
jgi:hypothetical protein